MYSSFGFKNNELTKSMYASKMADVMYHQNGTGRDTYIYNNNGGFSAMKVNEVVCIRPGRFAPQ
jgi:nitrous oxidase accessory protein NosD